MSRRKLTTEENELWQKVVKNAERMHPAARKSEPAMPAGKPDLLSKAKEPPAPKPIEPFTVGSRSRHKPVKHDLKPALARSLASDPVQMDGKAFRKMKRGKLKPEGKLDLHGMRIDTAHPALTRFILSAHSSGKRLVLVITGKGKDRDEPGPMPVPRGVLRHQVPQWLSLPPLAQVVLQVTPAHVSHGGGGAYYVYLRRSR